MISKGNLPACLHKKLFGICTFAIAHVQSTVHVHRHCFISNFSVLQIISPLEQLKEEQL